MGGVRNKNCSRNKYVKGFKWQINRERKNPNCICGNDSLIKVIRDNYDTENEAKEAMRHMDFLDEFRNENFPDDVAVLIYKKGLQIEQV